jgi:Holliday junction DNA helicase RuvB
MTPAALTSPEQLDGDEIERGIRPQSLSDFTGQPQVIENLDVFIRAAKSRGEALDHVLLYGPPGLGKTTLANIVSKEMGVNFRATSGPLLTKAGDLAAILTNLQANDVLFIDEIHRLNSAVEEVLYPAMEDFKLDLIIGEGPSARTVRIDLPQFTLVGATTRIGLLTGPLRDRFGIPLKLNFYDVAELKKVVTRASSLLKVSISPDGANEIAKRSRGTPRIAVRLLKRVRDFAHAAGKDSIDASMADATLKRLEVDGLGLDSSDHRYLKFITEHYDGGPVGVETIAAALSEARDTIEETIEPFLLQLGFLQRTPRGRVMTTTAFKHLGLAAPKKPVTAEQLGLLDGDD